jgi:hypothetical protein
LGLVALPNNDLRRANNSTEKATQSVIEVFDIPESDAQGLRKRFPLEKEEEEYISRCMAKWGDDYKSMFRDIKVNSMQHTEQMLLKTGARYLLLTPEQRRVEVPDNIRELLPDDQQ